MILSSKRNIAHLHLGWLTIFLLLTVGSGAVGSLVKQIDRRLKILGAQWSADNVPQVLKHRVGYLNGDFTRAEPRRTLVNQPE